MNDLSEARVLDLFSGTGNLGIEALSRGATFVTLVESHKKSINIIQENLELLEIEQEVELIRQDVFKFLESYDGDPYQVILVDPPFTEAVGHEVMLALSKSKVFGAESVVAIETAKKERIEQNYEKLVGQTTRNYGDKILSIFRSQS